MVKAWDLDGWKEIAATLCVSERTARSWRLTLGLPVVALTPRRVVTTRAALASWSAARCRSLPDAPLVDEHADVAMVGT